MAKCPSCGNEVAKPSKEWDVKPPKGKGFHVMLFACSCGRKFRKVKK